MNKKLVAAFFTIGLIASSTFIVNSYAQSDNSSNGLRKINETTYVHFDANNIQTVGWKNDYHFNNSNPAKYGHMDYGWFTDNTGTYFLNTTIGNDFGKKVKNWNWIDGFCYYFDENGRLIYNMIPQGEGYRTNEKGQWIENGVAQFVAGKGLVSDIHSYKLNPNIGTSPTLGSDITSSIKESTAPNSEVKGYVASHVAPSSGVSNYISPPNETTVANTAQFMSDTLIIEAKKDVSVDYVRKAVASYNGSIEKSYASISTYKIKFSDINSSSRLIEIKNALQFDLNFNNVYLDMITNISQ